MNRKYIVLICFILLLSFSCNRTGSKTAIPDKKENISKASVINNKTIAILDNQKLTNSDFKNYLRAKYSDLKDVLDNKNLVSRLFDSYIEHAVILKSSKNEDIAITDEEIEDYSGNNNIQLNENTKKSVIDMLRIEKFLFSKIYSNISVTKYEIQKYYDSNRDQFSQKRRIELYQILLGKREDAIKIRGMLLNNPDEFENIAVSKSIAQDSDKKGYMGIFELGDLPREIEKVVFYLPVNQISQVVESQFGYHIFKITNIFNSKVQNLTTVSDEIEKILFNRKIVEEYSRYIKILRNSIDIKIFYNELFFEYIKPKGD